MSIMPDLRVLRLSHSLATMIRLIRVALLHHRSAPRAMDASHLISSGQTSAPARPHSGQLADQTDVEGDEQGGQRPGHHLQPRPRR
jgi:hypothetical protein